MSQYVSFNGGGLCPAVVQPDTQILSIPFQIQTYSVILNQNNIKPEAYSSFTSIDDT